MLVISKPRPSARRASDGDEGAILVAVVVVMFVGFVIASTIAASVLFTIQANNGNKSTTQAFIAAESGRDKVVSQIANGCTGIMTLQQSPAGTSPKFAAQAYTTAGSQPSSPSGLTTNCPTASTSYVLIQSTGTGPDGSTSTINSVYRWSAQYSSVPGGVVTYFSGNVSQSVSNYIGDLVLRNGNWSCIQNATMTGDLYVLSGTAQLSQGCTVKGDIWSNGPVSDTASGWSVLPNAASGSHGDITTNGYVDFTASGTAPTPSPNVGGSISAGGNISLKATASKIASVGGTVTSKLAATVDPGWTTGTVTQTTGVNPTFVPSLAWLKAATKWIDLDNTSGWGALTSGDCTKLKNDATASAYVAGMLSSATTPLVLDFTGCKKAVSVTFSSPSKLTRDVAIIVDPDSTMTMTLDGLASSGSHKLMLIHSDGSLTYRNSDGDPAPNCGTDLVHPNGSNDTFGTKATQTAAVNAGLSVMVYTPCGLTGTVNSATSLVGQLYANDTTNFHAGSSYTCQEMSWPSALSKLGCKIKGPGGLIDDTTIVQKLGALIVQTEQ